MPFLNALRSFVQISERNITVITVHTQRSLRIYRICTSAHFLCKIKMFFPHLMLENIIRYHCSFFLNGTFLMCDTHYYEILSLWMPINGTSLLWDCDELTGLNRKMSEEAKGSNKFSDKESKMKVKRKWREGERKKRGERKMWPPAEEDKQDWNKFVCMHTYVCATSTSLLQQWQRGEARCHGDHWTVLLNIHMCSSHLLPLRSLSGVWCIHERVPPAVCFSARQYRSDRHGMKINIQ